MLHPKIGYDRLARNGEALSETPGPFVMEKCTAGARMPARVRLFPEKRCGREGCIMESRVRSPCGEVGP